MFQKSKILTSGSSDTLERKSYAIPHLEALISGQECSNWQGCGITFKFLKSTYLPHSEAKSQF